MSNLELEIFLKSLNIENQNNRIKCEFEKVLNPDDSRANMWRVDKTSVTSMTFINCRL